ncbi:MAG: hypothetical protein L3J83_01140 [Proteobacteria bacterium]|nr:hypothetical protein [Pseudomonadota bacterium]
MKKIILMVFVSIGANAANLTIPNTFVANTPAVASEVNGNFGAVEAAVDDNDARIVSLEATIASLQARLSAVENNTVLELDGLLGYSELNGYPTAEFSAVNVQVNSGLNFTFSSRNGLGNIIIGYNEPFDGAPEFCSNPIYTDSVNCIGNGFLWERNVRTGSHNLVLGVNNSYSSYGSYIGGLRNIVNAPYASVFAGFENHVSSQNATISGGARNYANAVRAHISGGWNNRATARDTNVSGGINNTASGNFSSVSGGESRSAVGTDDWVAGSLFEDN